MHPHHDAPIFAAHRLAVFSGGFLGDVPQLHQRSAADGVAGNAERQHRGAVLAGHRDAGRRLHRGHRHRHMGRLVGAQLDYRLVQLEPVALVADGVGFGHQAHNDAQRLVHHFPLPLRSDAQHQGVGGQGAGADAQNHPPPGQVVQLHEAVGDHIGVVVGQADHAGAEADVAGALGGGGHKHFRRGDGFPPGAVMLADVGFIVAQRVEPLD